MKKDLLLFLFALLFTAACSPASISRIGPSLPPREAGCEVEILDPGKTPFLTHRDIGMISLQNCQAYQTNPCRQWLADAVCEMGGQVAYLPDPTPPKNDIDPINFRVMVAVYVVGDPGMSNDGQEAESCKEPQPEEEAEPERCVE